MAAATVYSERFDSNGKPIRLKNGAEGTGVDGVEHTVAITSVDDAGDRVVLIPLPIGARILGLLFKNDDLDDGAALDADLVLSDGSTDVILFNGGANYQTATTETWVLPTDGSGAFRVATGGTRGWASIDFLVNTAAGTDAEGEIAVVVFWDRP